MVAAALAEAGLVEVAWAGFAAAAALAAAESVEVEDLAAEWEVEVSAALVRAASVVEG